MQVTIHRQHIELSVEEKETLLRRLHFALDRFAQRIHSVAAYVGDMNGPRGGIDKRCRLVVELAGAAPVTVESRASSLAQLFGEATGRVARAVRHQIDRMRQRRNGRGGL